jgi:hypothetical protein
MKPLHSSRFPLNVSPSMIAEGVRVLRESGVLFAECPVDYRVVRRILETALAVHQHEQESLQASHPPLAECVAKMEKAKHGTDAS